MPSRRPAGLLLGRDKSRLVRQALDRSLLRSLIQLTGQCHAGETLGNISAPYAHARRPDDITDPLRATRRGRALSLPHEQKNSTAASGDNIVDCDVNGVEQILQRCCRGHRVFYLTFNINHVVAHFPIRHAWFK